MHSLKAFKDPVYRIINPVVLALVRRGTHPNLITTLGFVVTIAAGVLFHLDHVRWAGLLVVTGGILDIFDGQVARASALASKFGSFYDSTLDRVSEIVVFLGLLSLYNQYGRELADVWMVYVIVLAMGGSLMVSYTRARAEALGVDCSAGFMQRAERIVLLGGGCLLFRPHVAGVGPQGDPRHPGRDDDPDCDPADRPGLQERVRGSARRLNGGGDGRMNRDCEAFRE